MSYSLRPPATRTHVSPQIEWEETPCLLCGGSDWSPLLEGPDHAPGAGLWFMVAQCKECGLCFTNPRPTPQSMAQFYRTGYPAHERPDVEFHPSWWHRLPGLKNLRKSFPLHGSGRMLDFGCGNGSFLKRMQHQGWNVLGVDLADTVVDRLRAQGIPAISGTLPHSDLRAQSFDVVTMWQSLEHAHEPLDVLRAAQRVLVPGGKIVVATPNIDSLPFHWFGQAWNGLDLPRHLTHFAPWTLRLMMHRAGFRSLKISMLRRSGWLRTSARQAVAAAPRASLWQRSLRTKTMSNLASWYSVITRQSDCMMIEGVRR